MKKITTIFLFALATVAVSANSIQGGICLAPQCVKIANELLKNMNTSIDPCEDFYNFACGNYEKNTALFHRSVLNHQQAITDKVRNQLVSVLEEPIQQNELKMFKTVKTYYQSCKRLNSSEEINFKGIISFMKNFGGWPVIEDEWNEADFEWIEFAAIAAKEDYQSLVWFLSTERLRPEISNKTHLMNGILANNYRSFIDYLNITKYEQYFVPVLQIAKLMGANKATVAKDIKDVINLIVQLEKAVHSNVEYVDMTIAELQEKCPTIPWLRFINDQLKMDGLIQIPQDTIAVKNIKYLEQLEIVLKSTPKRVLANSLFFKLITDVLRAIPEEELQKIIVDQQIFLPFYDYNNVKTKCFRQMINSMLQVPLYILYRQKVIGNLDADNIKLIDNKVKTQMKTIIHELDWMSDEDKKLTTSAVDHENDMEYLPDDILDASQINDFMNQLQVDGDDYLAMSLNASTFLTYAFRKHKFDKSSPTWMDKISLQPYEDDDSYVTGYLEAWLQHLYNEIRPVSVNYGLLGTVIANRIAFGMVITTLESSSGEKYLEKIQCIAEKFQNYKIPEIDENLTITKLFKAKLVAAMTAIKFSYKLYLAASNDKFTKKTLPGINLTTNQLFWLSAAQLGCEKRSLKSLQSLSKKLINEEFSRYGKINLDNLEKYTMIGSLRNMREFANDFNCPKKSYMNPAEICSFPF